MWEASLHILLIVFLPPTFAASLLRAVSSRWEWWSSLALTLAVTSWSFVIGRWDLVGYFVRFLPPILTIAAAVIGWGRRRRSDRKAPRGSVWNLSVAINLVLALVFFAQAGIGAAGLFSKEPGIELEFPLRNGTFFVVQGGSTTLVNYHAAYAAQAYALDISGLNALGARASGVYPAELEKYAIFGESVYSPCAGEIVAARDGLPDYPPPERDSDRPEGNFVTVRCEGADVILAHLQEGSVSVRQGDRVESGQLLGRVGNSGNTTEPHLHLHAERWVESPDGAGERVGVPMRFNGRFLGRNSVVAGE